MGINIFENGMTGKKMVKEYILGLVGISMLVVWRMVVKMVKEHPLSLMEESM